MSLLLDDLALALAAGQRPALARALSLAERDAAAAEGLLRLLAGRIGRAHVIGITGPPGAGKSTLVGAMVRQFLQMGRSVAVLAVDPSSPLTGGALLGDRFRIGESSGDERCFIRSTATRGSLGGLTRAARQMVQLMDAAGYDLVLVETVGTGQSEIDIAKLADSLLVAFPPGLGDELQAIKAGILELADLLVITKSDTPGATLACQALQAVAPLWHNAPPIHAVSALSGEGVTALAEAILARVNTATPLMRRDDAVGQVATVWLTEGFQRLHLELGRRLRSDPDRVWTLQVLNPEENSRPSGLLILCSIGSGADVFQLGIVVGAAMVVANDIGMSCVIADIDPATGQARLLLGLAT